MITDLAVAQTILLDREMKLAEQEKKRQAEYARTGAIALAPKGENVLARVAGFVREFRPTRGAQVVPEALMGDAAA